MKKVEPNWESMADYKKWNDRVINRIMCTGEEFAKDLQIWKIIDICWEEFKKADLK